MKTLAGWILAAAAVVGSQADTACTANPCCDPDLDLAPSPPQPNVQVDDAASGAPLCNASGIVTCNGYDNGTCTVSCRDDAPPPCQNTNGGTFTMTASISAPDHASAMVSFPIGLGNCGRTGIYAADAGASASVRLAATCAKLSSHSDGLGDAWSDCAPPGTIDPTEAARACAANSSLVCNPTPCRDVDGDAGALDYNAGIEMNVAVCTSGEVAATDIGCTCWAYAGPAAGHVRATNVGCQCPSASDPMWQ